ncbi:MAG TPA: rhomboid family intramembrane serine protease [Hyphomonas sp.]|nr:hypothetical protein [Hyphomonas sp.]HRJ01415.1 rhomboid family intramembrane serine protease [Hyphomonas sp.]
MPGTQSKPPIINAPLPVTVFAVLLVAAHAVVSFLPGGLQNFVFYNGALIPERFWASPDFAATSGLAPYANALAAAVPMVASAFLHGGWMHVIMNAAFLVAFAKPLLELMRRVWPGREPGATLVLLGLFLTAQIAASLTFLALNYPAGPMAVGASGGVSGLLAAILMLRGGPQKWLLTREFLLASAAYMVINVLMVFVGPALLGASIAWQAHIGGYAGGALFMRLVLWRMGG